MKALITLALALTSTATFAQTDCAKLKQDVQEANKDYVVIVSKNLFEKNENLQADLAEAGQRAADLQALYTTECKK